MAYPNRLLGEFAVSDQDNWPLTIRFNERKPLVIRGHLNPWETERLRAVWIREKDAWTKIQPLQKEYANIEKGMEKDVNIFNAHLAELERVTKKKTGLGPIGSYGGMALAVIPGFGWFSAVFSAVSMVFEMIGGNKKKKRVNELMRIMEEAQQRLAQGQKRLLQIQEELKVLLQTTEIAKQEVSTRMQYELEQTRLAGVRKDQEKALQEQSLSVAVSRIRQASPKRVYSDASLG
jgi:hypothetical protein